MSSRRFAHPSVVALLIISSWHQDAISNPCESNCAGYPARLLVSDDDWSMRRSWTIGEDIEKPFWVSSLTFSNHVSPAGTAWMQGTGLIIGPPSEGATTDIVVHYVDDPADFDADDEKPAYAALIVETGTGNIVKVDIYINCFYYGDIWNDETTECPSPDKLDLTGALVHELGHALGLDDQSYLPSCSVMFEALYLQDCSKRSIADLDKQAILCMYPPLVTDATIDGFGVVDGVARWTVLREDGSAYYVVEETAEPGVPGRPIHFEAHGIGEHAYAAEFDSLLWYRLIEIDTEGKQKHLGSARPKSRVKTFAATPAGVGVEPESNWVNQIAAPRRETTSSPSPTLVIFADEQHEEDVEDIAVSWELNFGQTVAVHLLDESDPAQAREDVHVLMKDYFQQHGTRLFHIVAGGEIVAGSGELPQSVFVASSDQELADLNYDGLPDVVVTRWPSGDPAAQWLRMMEYNFVPTAASTASTSFFVEDIDQGQYEGSGALTALMVDDLKDVVTTIKPGETIRTLKGSSYPDLGDRNTAAASHINAYRPELIVLLATRSNASAPGRFFNRALGVSPLWDMSMISLFVPPTVVLAASCGSAAFDAVGGYFAPTCNDFLEASLPWGTKGAVAWMGAYDDTDQTANHMLSRFVLEEMFANPYRSMAESWLVALNRAYGELGSVEEYRAALNGMIFLGDPLSAFRCLPRIRSFVKPAGTQNLLPMPANSALVCPKNDGDHVVVEIAIDADEYDTPLTAQDLTISQPADELNMAFYPDGQVIVADAAPDWTTSDPDYPEGCYKSTFTIEKMGGCGESWAAVMIQGETVGHARIRLKSPDVHIGEPTRALVNLLDFGILGASLPSNICCTQPKPYNECVDFVAPDGIVDLMEFGYFGTHFGHGDPTGQGYGAPPMAHASSTGVVRLEFVEERPVVGEHLLRVGLAVEGVEPFKAIVVFLKNKNEILEFAGWTEDAEFTGETVCTEVTRDGDRELFVGVLGSKLGVPSAQLGVALFRVRSNEELVLTDEDLALVVADVLTTGGSSLRMTSPADRSLRPAVFENVLAQNYPNPFNPSTTIAFSIAKSTNVDLAVFDVAGRLVRTLVDENKAADNYRITWDGMDDIGNRAASGVYFYRLRAGSFVATKRMVLLK